MGAGFGPLPFFGVLMLISPIKGFRHDRLGFLAKDVPVEIADSEGARLCRLGHANPAGQSYDTKVIHGQPVVGPIPSQAVGATSPSSASPAAPASPQTTAKPSKRGGKRSRKTGE